METHGISIEIDWSKLKVGASFFVPGIDQSTLQAKLREEMRRMHIDVITRKVIERNILGVRVWRVS